MLHAGLLGVICCTLKIHAMSGLDINKWESSLSTFSLSITNLSINIFIVCHKSQMDMRGESCLSTYRYIFSNISQITDTPTSSEIDARVSINHL